MPVPETNNAVYLEDLSVGQVFETGDTELTAESIIDFARQYDPQPMHLSDAGAAHTIFGSLAASGWHMTALTMRLMVDATPFGTTPLIGAEISNIRFTQPARPGMMLTVRAEVMEILPGSNPERGFVIMNGTTLDRNTSQAVVTQTWRMLLPKKQA